MNKPRPTYHNEVRYDTGLRWLNGQSLYSIAKSSGIHVQTLKRWKSKGFYFSNWAEYDGNRLLFYIRVGSRLYGFERTRVSSPKGSRLALVLKGEHSTLPGSSAKWYL